MRYVDNLVLIGSERYVERLFKHKSTFHWNLIGMVFPRATTIRTICYI